LNDHCVETAVAKPSWLFVLCEQEDGFPQHHPRWLDAQIPDCHPRTAIAACGDNKSEPRDPIPNPSPDSDDATPRR